MSLTIQLPFSIEQQLRDKAARQGVSLEKYVAQVLSSGVSDASGGQQAALTEEDLLLKINTSTISQKDLERFKSLDKRRKAETLTPSEHEELLRLVDRIEMAHAERLKWVLALASLRKVPFQQLLTDLGIKPAKGNEK
jgi:hypothetical protein